MIFMRNRLFWAGLMVLAVNAAAVPVQFETFKDQRAIRSSQGIPLEVPHKTQITKSKQNPLSFTLESTTSNSYSFTKSDSSIPIVVAESQDQGSRVIRTRPKAIDTIAEATSISKDSVMSITEFFRVLFPGATTREEAENHATLRRRDDASSSGAPISDPATYVKTAIITAAVSVFVFVAVVLGFVLLAVLRK